MSNPSGKSPGWRSASDDRTAKRRDRSERSWRKPVEVSGVAEQLAWERRRRLLRRAAVGFATLACFVVAVVLILLLRGTETGIVVLAEDESAEVFPFNPQADRDLHAFKSVTDQQDASLFRSDPLELIEVQQSHKLPEALKSFRNKDVLVLYVNVLSGRDGKGPFLVPGDARPDVPSSYYRFDGDNGLWQTMKDVCPADQKKLVILDVNHVTADWRMGLLANDAVRDLQSAAKEYEIANLVVIASCQPGERSWTSTNLGGAGQSVFGYYLARALAGDADIDGDHNIDLRELFEYVNIHTHEWVNQNRDPGGQHPTLIYPTHKEVVDRADDTELNFTVAEVVKGVAPDWLTAKAEARASAEQKLDSMWRRRDKLLGDVDDMQRARAYWHDPVLWRTLTWQLRRAEERFLHGYNDPAVLNKAEQTLRELERRRPDDAFAGLGVEDELRANIALQCNFTMQEAAAHDPLPPNFEHGPDPPARFQERFEAVRNTLPEVHLANVLRDVFPQRYSNAGLPSNIVSAAIQTRRAGEMASSGPLGTFGWVEELILAGDAARREGEDRLFLGAGEQTLGGVRERQENLELVTQKLDEARAAYTTAIEIARDVHYAVLIHDRLLAELPELARWASFRNLPQDEQAETDVAGQHRRVMDLFQNEVLTRLGQGDLRLGFRDLAKIDAENDQRIDALKGLHALEGRILLLMAHALELSGRLQSPSARPADEEPREHAQALRKYARQVESLLRYTQEQLKIAADQLLPSRAEQPQFRDWRKIRGFLQYSLLQADQRQQLRKRLDDYGDKLQQQFESPTVNEEPKNRKPVNGSEAEAHDALWHSFWGIQVLALSGHDPVPLWRDWNNARAALPQEDASEQTASDAETVWDRLAQLGDDLRGDTTRGFASLDDQLRLHLERRADGQLQAREELAHAVRLARALDGYDASQLGVDTDPVQQLRAFDIARLCLTQADRYLEDYWADWYDRRVEECIDAVEEAAADLAPSHRAVITAALEEPENGLGDRFDRRQKARLTVAGPPYVVQFPNSLVAQIPLDVNAGADVPSGISTAWMNYNADPKLIGARAAVTIAGGQVAGTKVELRKAGPDDSNEPCEEVELEVPAQVWYRGHTAQHQPPGFVVVIPCPPRGIERRYRPPGSTGQLLLAGRDVRRPIVFILDCSHSMKDGGKFENGVAALKQALKVLHQNPQMDAAFRAALICYGHRLQKLTDKPLDRKDDWPGKPPGHNDPFSDVEIVHPAGPLDNRAMQQIEFFLDRLGPWGNTPLNLSLLEALDHTAAAPGATVVAITDGVANDNTYQGRNAELKRKIRNRGENVDVHVVGFALANERDKVQNFAGGIGAVFHDAPNGGVLAARLMEALNLDFYSVLPESDGQRPIRVRLGQPSQIGPGGHTLRLPNGKTQPLPISGGEHLSAELKFGQLHHEKYFGELGIRSGERIQNPRIDEATPPAGGASAPNDGPTHLACRKFDVSDATRTAEFRFSVLHVKEDLFVRRPPEIFFEVFPKSDGATSKLRTVDISWAEKPYQSIPTWDFGVEDWPAGSAGELAIVRAFWKPERTPADVLEPMRWNDVRNGVPVEFPGGARCEVTAEYQAQDHKAVVKLTLPTSATVDEAANRELAHMRVEVGYDRGGFTPVDLPYRSEFRKSDSLTVAFDVDEKFDPRAIWVAVTSLEARQTNAFEAVLDGIRYRRGF